MDDFISRLDTAIRAVAPIHGVSIGRKADRTTWGIDFKPTASEQHQTAAFAILESFSISGPQESLETVKADMKAKVDSEWLAARNRVLTPGADGEYAEAVREASRYVATSGAGIYPLLNASVRSGEAADLAAAAALISAKDAEWVSTAAELRRLRLTAKKAIDLAEDADQAESAARVSWPV